MLRTDEPGGSILVVDDDAGQRQLLRVLLERIGLEVSEAADGETALAAATANRPDLVLLDVSLPHVGGYEVCHELRQRYGRELPIFFVSGTRIGSGDRTAGLLLGGDDYITKPFDPDELLARVRGLLRRMPQRRVAAETPFPELTAREREILGLLATGLRQNEIARQLVISPRTVSTHIQHILEKLHVNSRAQAVALAHRQGVRPS